MLPGRSLEQEDAFLQGLLDAPAEDLHQAIEEAMAARRPGLAARLVGLLPDDDHAPAVEAARRAANLLLLAEGDADEAWTGLDDAWAELRRRRVRRKQRMRRSGDPDRRRPK